MQKKETAIEVKVGALVLFATGLLVAMVLILGDFSFSDGMEFHVQYENAGGLKPGADVAISGINVGSVTALRFVQNEESRSSNLSAVAVQATLKVDHRFADAVRDDSQFYITTRGILGEPYIEISTRTHDGKPVAPGQVLRGVDPPRMEIIIGRATELLELIIELLDDPDIQIKDLVANASSLLKHLDEIVVDNRDEIDATIKGVRLSADEASKLLAALNVAVDDGTELRASVNDARAALASARRITTRVEGRVDPVLNDLTATAQNARVLVDTAGRLLNDNEEKITATLDNLHATSGTIATVTTDAERLLADLRDGEGTIGALLTEREVYEDLKEMMRIIKQQPWKILWKE
jgi:phospholipid/cholesterol/gamma-HCH transport system substrate-binding protein